MNKPINSRGMAAAQIPERWEEYVTDFRRAGHETVDWIA